MTGAIAATSRRSPGLRGRAGWAGATIGAALVLGVGTCGLRTWSSGASHRELAGGPSSQSAGNGTAAPEPAKPPRFADTIDVSTFLRGNLHTHSSFSDGDAPPAKVYAYYRDHGYAFVALTDHNTRTDPAAYANLARPGFVMIPGEEVTTTAAGKPVHVNALCSRATIGGGTFATAREALAWAVARVTEQGAIALVNHPNFDWALAVEDLPAARGAALLEIWSGHPYVHSTGDALRPSHEAMWTTMLDEGETFAGVAVDDTHNLLPAPRDPAARPLRAWVEVFGSQATEAAICDGLRRGMLYASAGPKLARIVVGGSAMSVALAEPGRVEFVGAEGAVLASPDEPAREARYELRGGERYVRARITGADGNRAWTQAYRVAR